MLKKDFTSFDLDAVVNELKTKLVDSRVNNIYQLDAKTLLLKLHKTNNPPMRLVLEAGRRLHLTNYSLSKPQTPPAFCMTLRKYLPGGWISDLEQFGFERVVTLKVATKVGTLKLILELFGEGNIVLADEKGEILQALFFKHMRDRNITRKEVYKLPPSNAKNPFKVDIEELEAGLQAAGETEIVKAIARFIGIGGLYTEELLIRAGIEKSKSSANLTNSDLNSVFSALQELLLAVSSQKLEPHIVLDEAGNFIDVLPIKLKRYDKFKIQSYASFSEALDEFYVRVTAAEKAVASIDVGQFKREADRLQRVITDQEKALQENNLEAERDKHIGDTIYAHLSEFQILLNKFSTTWKAGKDLSDVVTKIKVAKQSGHLPESYFESFNGRNLSINIRLADLSFNLNLRKNIYENAAEYYDRGKRSKQKMAGVLAALEDSRKKLSDINDQLRKVEALKIAAPAEALDDIVKNRVKNKEWFEKFRWFKSSEGFLVVAGKDAVSNEVLIKKYTDVYDVVFHTDVLGSPFAVVKTEGKECGEQTLQETAEFAAAYSRAWRESMGSADVYWVNPQQLSKSGPSGEFVPHGAFTISGKRNWQRGVALHLAIGIVEEDGIEFLGGPVNAVKKKTNTYVTLVPGDLKGKDLLKQILRVLILKLSKDEREKMKKATIEDIREFVPYTKGRIMSDSLNKQGHH